MTVIEKLEDLSNSMRDSLNKIDELLAQQKELASIVKAADSKIDFNEFINELNESNENYEKQIKVLYTRHQKLVELLNILYNATGKEKHTAELMLQVFGTIDVDESIEDKEA